MSDRIGRSWIAQGSMLSAGVLLVAALVGIVNYLGMRYYHRFDWTSAKVYTLSEKTVSILAGLDRDIDVTLFLPDGSPLHDASKELLERYAAKSPHIHFRAISAEKNLIEAQRLVDKFQLSNLNVVVFESGDDRRVVDDQSLADYDYSALQYGGSPEMTGFKGEEAFSGAILGLVEKRKPKVLLTTGHGEASLTETGAAGLSSVAEVVGKENVELTGWASLGQADVPADTDLLVIAGPRASFVEPELAAFGRYLDRGGRMLVLLDPDLAPAGGLVTTGLESWLEAYGVQVGENIVVDPDATVPLYGAETILANASGSHPIVRSLEQARIGVIVALARSVGAGRAPEGTAAQVLLETTAQGWGETDLANLRAIARDSKDLTGPVPLAVAVSAQAKEAGPEDARGGGDGVAVAASGVEIGRCRSARLAAGGDRRLRPCDQQFALANRQPDADLQRLQLAARPPEAPRDRPEEAGADPDGAHSGPTLGTRLVRACRNAGAGDRRWRRGPLPSAEIGECVLGPSSSLLSSSEPCWRSSTSPRTRSPRRTSVSLRPSGW